MSDWVKLPAHHSEKRKWIIRTRLLLETSSDYIGLVRIMGLEPIRMPHRYLKPACLPIPPYPRITYLIIHSITQNDGYTWNRTQISAAKDITTFSRFSNSTTFSRISDPSYFILICLHMQYKIIRLLSNPAVSNCERKVFTMKMTITFTFISPIIMIWDVEKWTLFNYIKLREIDIIHNIIASHMLFWYSWI